MVVAFENHVSWLKIAHIERCLIAFKSLVLLAQLVA